MEEKNSYTKEDILEALVEENRKFRRDIMKILYGVIIGLCLTVLIIVFGFCNVTYTYFYSPSEYEYTIRNEAISSNTSINKNINKNKDTNKGGDK